MLFTIHHVAGSGGSIVSKAISAATNSILVSEINPFAPIRNENIKPFFDPTSILWHLTYNSKEISYRNKLKYFLFQMEVAIDHAKNLSMNLIFRDHTHSTFNFLEKDFFFNKKKVDSLFIESVRYFYELRNSQINFPRAIPILSIRHPLDNFLSARKNNWLQYYCGLNNDIDNYCKSLLKLQTYMQVKENAEIIRYEDLCIDMDKTLSNIFNKIEVDFKIPSLGDINNIKVTGQSGRQSENIALRDRLISEIDEDLIDKINMSPYYQEYCKINKYNPEYKDFSINNN